LFCSFSPSFFWTPFFYRSFGFHGEMCIVRVTASSVALSSSAAFAASLLASLARFRIIRAGRGGIFKKLRPVWICSKATFFQPYFLFSLFFTGALPMSTGGWLWGYAVFV